MIKRLLQFFKQVFERIPNESDKKEVKEESDVQQKDSNYIGGDIVYMRLQPIIIKS